MVKGRRKKHPQLSFWQRKFAARFIYGNELKVVSCNLYNIYVWYIVVRPFAIGMYVYLTIVRLLYVSYIHIEIEWKSNSIFPLCPETIADIYCDFNCVYELSNKSFLVHFNIIFSFFFFLVYDVICMVIESICMKGYFSI